MKLRYLGIALFIIVLTLSGCKDNVPIETSDDGSETENGQSKDIQQKVDKEIEKERDEIKQYMNGDMNEVVAQQNKAMEAFEKAQNIDSDKDQYEVFVNETLPATKKSLQAAKALKGNANPEDLDQLEDKLIKPLQTFVNMLEYKVEAMEAKTEQEKRQLEEKFEEYAKKYIEELKAYYNKLQAIGEKYDLDIDLDNLKVLKEQIQRTIEIAESLHISGDHLKKLITFQQGALNALDQLVGEHDSWDKEQTGKLREDLFPELDKLFDRDEVDEKVDREKLDESFKQFKKATKDNLNALEMRKEGMDKDDKELIEKSHEKYKTYEKEIDKFRSNLEEVKSKINQHENRPE